MHARAWSTPEPAPLAQAPAKPAPRPAGPARPGLNDVDTDAREAQLRALALLGLGDDDDEDDQPSAGPSGTGGTDPTSVLASWSAAVREHVRPHFNPLPGSFRSNPTVQCLVRVTADPRTGAVLSADISKSSGSQAYDGAAVRAVWAASPLPLPPRTGWELLRSGFELRFTPPS